MSQLTPKARQVVINMAATGIAFGLLVMLAYALYRLSSQEVPTANRDALMVVIGILAANFATVVNFFFGSSSEAKRQTEAIGDLASTAKAAQAALPTNGETANVTLEPGESTTIKAEGEDAKT